MKTVRFCIVLLLLFPLSAVAEWKLEQSADGHWIVTRNEDGHQFIVGGTGASMQFLLILSVPEPDATFPDKVTVSIDRGPRRETPLTLLDRNPEGVIFRIEIPEDLNTDMIRRMIAGVRMRLAFSDEESGRTRDVDFSLLGFTVVYNDLLIANEVGRLDPNWLIQQNRERELICYYVANLSVQALQNRIKGMGEAQNLSALPRTGMGPVDENLPEIVKWVHQLSRAEMPTEPRAEKYGLYKRCMNGLSIEG